MFIGLSQPSSSLRIGKARCRGSFLEKFALRAAILGVKLIRLKRFQRHGFSARNDARGKPQKPPGVFSSRLRPEVRRNTPLIHALARYAR
jgi:hypothetical protein